MEPGQSSRQLHCDFFAFNLLAQPSSFLHQSRVSVHSFQLSLYLLQKVSLYFPKVNVKNPGIVTVNGLGLPSVAASVEPAPVFTRESTGCLSTIGALVITVVPLVFVDIPIPVPVEIRVLNGVALALLVPVPVAVGAG
jgi:hypothetical protein